MSCLLSKESILFKYLIFFKNDRLENYPDSILHWRGKMASVSRLLLLGLTLFVIFLQVVAG